MVQFTETVDYALTGRNIEAITLTNPQGNQEIYEILSIFPFTSESKRMGIIVKSKSSGEITFYVKGADVVMSKIVSYSDWLDEECGNMAREGLRTLVFGKKVMSQEEYNQFSRLYKQAKTSMQERDANIRRVVEGIESDLELLCLTGVEDKLQDKVKETLELLLNANIRVWMLTGDKMETAKCIAISAKLVRKNQAIFLFSVAKRIECEERLSVFSKLSNTVLIIDGNSLQLCLDHFTEEFFNAACAAPSVVCCRCR